MGNIITMQRRTTTLCLVLALAVAVLGAKLPAPSGDYQKDVEMLIDHALNNNAMSLADHSRIYMSMLQYQAPIAKLYKIFYTNEKQLNVDETRLNLTKGLQDKDCGEEDIFRTIAIQQATEAQTVSGQARAACATALSSASASLVTNLEDQANRAAYIQHITEVREAQNKAFIVSRDKTIAAIKAMEGVIPYLKSLKKGLNRGALLEESHHQEMKKKLADKAGEIFLALVELDEFDHEGAPELFQLMKAPKEVMNQFKELKQMIDWLIGALKNYLMFLELMESQQVTAYVAERDLVLGLVKRLKAVEDVIRAYIYEMNQCITNEDGITQLAINKRNRNNEFLEKAKSLCAAFGQEYEAQKAVREQNRQVFNEILGWIKEYFGDQAQDPEPQLPPTLLQIKQQSNKLFDENNVEIEELEDDLGSDGVELDRPLDLVF
eukprot:TRINITY_DN498_c0_g1_i1.p1 TRINITY_DN498_c0_g1~~TRINITY_DN498_c0_g1_i1.p1  ORF type:complete len:436 (+),score=148.67 TRINITY_DN498_c0_g1_i1:102-1409(+)